MRHSTKITTFLIAVLALTATSCYTQLYSTHPSSSGGYYSSTSDNERVASGNRSLEERSASDEVVNEEDYTLGYDDGWEDAEGYYFKDYEAQRWYEEYGINLAHDPYVRHYTLNHYAYTRGYSPYYSYYYPYYPYYSHVNSWSFSLGFNVGWGYSHWYPHYGYRYNPYYGYYAYPGYYPYYGNYWGWGYGAYYGNTVVIYKGSRGTARNYGPRGNGLTSRGSAVTRQTRSDARVRNTAPRSSVRSNARSRNVSNTRSRGTVNRSGTTRSRSSSTVRSRSGSSSNSRGTVNRSGSSSRSRSSGSSVNRSRSSSSSSRSRGNGSVSQSRSSSQSRTNVGSEGVIISRGNSIITNRENDHRRRTVTDRSSTLNTRNRTSSVNNRIRDYNNQQDRSRVETNRPQTRRERSLNSLRSRLLDQKADSPEQHYTPSRSRSSNIFNSQTAREIYKSVIGNTSNSRSRSSSSSVGRSSSSNNRSSSVSRSRSNSSSRSSVRSSRSSSSPKSRSSSRSSRSRSSSSRDKN